MAGENITDLVVIGIVVLSGLFAMARGLVKELLSIASWGGAVLVTLFGFVPLQPVLRDLISWPLGADIATGAALFLGSLFIFSFAAHFLAKLVQESAVGALDRSLGFVFGLLRGVLIAVVLYIAASWGIGASAQPDWFRNARTLPLVALAAKTVVAIVPPDLRGQLPRIVEPQGAAPETAPTGAQPPREGYRPEERRDMQRLIEGSQ